MRLRGEKLEIWDVYDRDRKRTGKTMIRGGEFKENAYHLVVHVCIFNSNDEMLIQQRQPFKEGWPNMWDVTVGGSAVSGDSSNTAAEREVFEEIGYKIDLTNKCPALTVNFDRGFDDIYIIKDDIDLNILKLQYEEVQRVKWANKDEIIRKINNGEFIPYYNSFIELLFDMKDIMGFHNKRL